MLNINIKSIPHNSHRYSTLGDYWTDEKGIEQFRVSDMGDWRMEFAVIIHELVEDFICKHRGIKEEDIMAFDVEFEKNRPEGNDDEPGDDPRAPYNKEHQIASAVERLICSYLDVNWNEYEQKCIDMFE